MSAPGSEAATADHGTAAAGAEAGAKGGSTARSTKPVVLPETFDGIKSWDDWYFHFENVAAVNGWSDEQKLKWLRVRLTGRAQKALLRIPEASRTTYEATRAALKARFDPESRQTRYRAEFQTRRKKANEAWADFADDLKSLVDKAYPDLQDEAREQLAMNAFLQQLTPPQVAFSVKQKRPVTLDDAVAATLEMESYVSSQVTVTSMLPASEEVTACPVSEVDKLEKLARVVEQLTEQVEKLKMDGPAQQTQEVDKPRSGASVPPRRRYFAGECWNCQRRGHIARNCPLRRPPQQGN